MIKSLPLSIRYIFVYAKIYLFNIITGEIHTENDCVALVWSDILKSLRIWLNCSEVSEVSKRTRKLLNSAHLSVSEVVAMTFIKRLRMCDCMFIQIYDRTLCIIQSLCVIITDILMRVQQCFSIIQFSQQPDESQHILQNPLYSTISLLYHSLPDNNPTLIFFQFSSLSRVSSSCHSTKCWKVLACISLKRQLDSAFNQVPVVVLVVVLLALTVIFLISQLHRTIFEENKKNSLRNL